MLQGEPEWPRRASLGGDSGWEGWCWVGGGGSGWKGCCWVGGGGVWGSGGAGRGRPRDGCADAEAAELGGADRGEWRGMGDGPEIGFFLLL
jgi:hypothetical protein